MNRVRRILLYCRRGFERECGAEILELTQAASQNAVQAEAGSGFVVCALNDPENPHHLAAKVPFEKLIFARQLIFTQGLSADLLASDRITPLLATAKLLCEDFSEIRLETADTNEAKELSTFCKKFAPPFQQAVRKAGLISDPANRAAPRLHVFFLDSTAAYVGLSLPGHGSPWLMGIPRLKSFATSPSRSALKLAEALLVFLGPTPNARLQPGMSAVDLGAAPGGWTSELIRRGLRVVAVDNGTLRAELIPSGMMDHRRVDGFRYRPHKAVDWMVCDIVERPSRIAALVAGWIAQGWCRDCIFNLKLPMKKRYEEVKRCRQIIEDELEARRLRYCLSFKQLFHDRQEITGYLSRP